MQTTQRYVDLDFAFPSNPVTEDVGKKVDARAINQRLKNLVLMILIATRINFWN